MRNSDERRAARHYRLRGYRILGANVWSGGYELDLIVRRGRRLVFCEVKGKTGDGFGDPLEMVDAGEAAAAAARRGDVAGPEPGLSGARMPVRGRRGAARRARARSRLTSFNSAATRNHHAAGYNWLAGRHYPRTSALVRTASARARWPQARQSLRREKLPAESRDNAFSRKGTPTPHVDNTHQIHDAGPYLGHHLRARGAVRQPRLPLRRRRRPHPLRRHRDRSSTS